VDLLTPDEMELWHAWKAAADAVLARVAADVTAETGLSGPDFAVLTRVAELGEGRLRQNRLAASTGFHRSRLSHHLARMEERALITREPADGGVDVLITEAGRAAVGKARPVHAAAVRRHLLEPLAGLDQAALRSALERLAPGGQEGGA
jgi:DNA-binding MarR family transcriptional regulator